MKNLLLCWTGHPLADVGVATLCAMRNKSRPEDLTLEDLDAVGNELKSAYTDSLFVAYLSCVYTMNAPYTNPTMGGDSRDASMKRLLQPHRSAPDAGLNGATCIFSGEPATHLMDRSQMPMLTGAGVLNFFPAGLSELPVAAPYLLAIQSLALGGRRSEGKLLIVHCDEPQFTLQFAKKYVAKNRQIIDLSKANRLPAVDDPENLLERELPGGLNKEKHPKYPDAKSPTSLIMADLVDVVSDRYAGRLGDSMTSVTAYLMSNSGQGPSLDILPLPSEFVQFLFALHGGDVAPKWAQLVQRAWRAGKAEADTESESDGTQETKPKTRKKANKPEPPRGAGKSRNELYNDLYSVFENGFCDWKHATRFIRRHLLCDPARFYEDPDHISHRRPKLDATQIELIDWKLTELFLRKVLAMDTERIQLIKEFATRLAELILEHNDRALFRDLVFTSNQSRYRNTLTRIQWRYAKERGKLALTFDQYIDIFLTPEPGERGLWSLVRDLISIRIVERLFEGQFFESQENREALEPPEQESEESK